MAKNNSVAILLIKPEFSNYEDIVRDDISGLNSFDVDNLGTVFFVNSEIYPPTWASSFFLDNDNFKSKLWNSSSEATLLIRMTFGDIERIFALIFGRGGSLINDTTIEDRFGLKTALNLIVKKILGIYQKRLLVAAKRIV
jgi:uncharacterized protein (TIGR04141 family)